MSSLKFQASKRTFATLFLMPLLLMAFHGTTHGQNFKYAENEEVGRNEFMIGTSIMIDFSGMHTDYFFGMTDENGYRYDLLSVLNPETGQAAGIPSEQLDKIMDIRADTYAELTGLVASAALEGKDKIKARFLAAEEEIQTLLTEEQSAKLEQIKHQNGIKQVGLAKYLGSSHFENSITDKDSESLKQVAKNYAELSKAGALDLLKEANKELLSQLRPEQQKQFESDFEAKFTETLLTTKMFSESYSAKKKFAKRKTDLYRILKVKNVRTSIGLSDDEYSQIKELGRDQRGQVTEKLSEIQNKKLCESVVSADLKRMGTVNSVCCGQLAKTLKIDDQQAEQLHATGQEINSELMQQLKAMKKDALSEAMSSLSATAKETLANAIGDYTLMLPSDD